MASYQTPYGEFVGTEEQYKEFLKVMKGEKAEVEPKAEPKPKKTAKKSK